ncbi:M81 family metallopeptidase [Cohnella silvisoli]|uniref:M81 family metallopeptidase n=1 Tax=Cohnella silvisoli TaxID=2873699 RepID=A0ABV1L2I4_9BACL|nr:M81 family metallopeptidase [Cohnella silvisoli]MCD9021604.1 M81 family metallopeptidase [Cohnella silvisoli]
MNKKMNIIVGALMQESNTFSSALSDIAGFYNYFYREGNEMLADDNPANELSGVLRAANEADVNVLPTVAAQACSAGPIKREALDRLKQTLLDRIEAYSEYDGVLLSLHGSWVAEDNDDADGEILSAVREKVGTNVPIVITLDSHANLTRTIAEQADAVVGYRTFPHIDYAETGYRAAQLLISIVRNGLKPHMKVVKVPMIVPAEAHVTYENPMRDLWQEAMKGENNGDSLATSLFIVQPWLDVAELGCAVVVVGRDAERAEREAQRLSELLWNRRKQFDIELSSVEEISKLLDAADKLAGPIIVSDSADSPGAGSPGDSNAVLRQLLELGVGERFTCLLSMVDAPAVRQAVTYDVGSTVKLTVGHSVSTDFGKPMEIEGVIAYTSLSGTFAFGGGTVANMIANMGQCAVVRIGRIYVLLMEHPTFTGDPAMYRSVGLEPLDADLVLVKSAAQFRAEYEQIRHSGIYILDTPGASTANLSSLLYTKAPRPLYPFADNF